MSQILEYICHCCGKEYFALPGSDAAQDHLCGTCHSMKWSVKLSKNCTVGPLNFGHKLVEENNVKDMKEKTEEEIVDENQKSDVTTETGKIDLCTHEFNSHTSFYIVEMMRGKKFGVNDLRNNPIIKYSHNFCVGCGCPITKNAKRCQECDAKRKRGKSIENMNSPKK